ncbi:acyloxyacyl hydrolase [Roseivivax sp. CAU 1761]
MADGTFAALMLVAGLTDMNVNHCSADGCLARSMETPRLSLSVGGVVPREADSAAEIYLRHDPATRFGPFGTALGLSVGQEGETWLGAGMTWHTWLGASPFYAELHAMPGLYIDNGGFDLGGPVAFRSGLELGYEAPSGWRYALSYDHRSNAGLYDENPGIETVQFRVSVPLR